MHLVATDAPPRPQRTSAWTALLTYGDRTRARRMVLPSSSRRAWEPVSPWASKATDIARNCGLALRRIERATEYRIRWRPACWATHAVAEQLGQVAALCTTG